MYPLLYLLILPLSHSTLPVPPFLHTHTRTHSPPPHSAFFILSLLMNNPGLSTNPPGLTVPPQTLCKSVCVCGGGYTEAGFSQRKTHTHTHLSGIISVSTLYVCMRVYNV